MVRADVDETVEAFAVDERFKVGADVDVGRGFACFGVAFDADRMLGACCRHVAETGLQMTRCPQILDAKYAGCELRKFRVASLLNLFEKRAKGLRLRTAKSLALT